MMLFVLTAMAGVSTDEGSDNDVCSAGGRPLGPVHVGNRPGRLGNTRDACVRSEVGIAGGGGLLVDTPNFYGRIQYFGALDARYAITDHVEVFGRIEGLRADNVIAPFSASSTGLGATSVGATVQLEQTAESVLAVHTQLILPTAPYVNAAPLALDVGLSAMRTIKGGDVHGGAVLMGQMMLGSGPAAERAGLTGRVGVSQRLSKNGVSFVLDLPISVGFTGGLDHVALATALRFGTGRPDVPYRSRGMYGELGLMAPLFGQDRTLVAGELRLGYRFR